MDLPDKLLQVNDVIEHTGDELDRVRPAIGLANALHDFAVGSLSQRLLDVEVLLDEVPKIFVLSRLLVFLHRIIIFKLFGYPTIYKRSK